jgi:lactate dehydrogenase-like 2-hydroxyacid dehydrogenase
LLRLKNVVVAPHLAWLILETLQGNFEDAMRNVKKVRAGLPPESRVA